MSQRIGGRQSDRELAFGFAPDAGPDGASPGRPSAPSDDDGRLAFLVLARMRSLRPRERLFLAARLPLDDLLALNRSQLGSLLGRGVRDTTRLPADVLSEAITDLRLLTHGRIGCTFYPDSTYPGVLCECADPPLVLFVRGEVPGGPSVAVVGTRRPSAVGRRAAGTLGLELGGAGIPVISGLARGIDDAAHAGCLAADGPTVAVLGTGVDVVYPRSAVPLARRIIESGGGMLSEYPPGTPARRHQFPERNRIIAGLSRAVVVVEAPESSGALITATFAAEEGREVAVHRAPLDGARGAGGRRLAEDGATVIRHAGELLGSWGEPVRQALQWCPPSGGRRVGSWLAETLRAELGGRAWRVNGEVRVWPENNQRSC